MTSEYCPIGNTKNCSKPCKKGEYVLKDRMGLEFPIYTDTNNCNSHIYNSKITSIGSKDLNVDSIRIDVLGESIDEINYIVKKQSEGERLEGEEYTSGNIGKRV